MKAILEDSIEIKASPEKVYSFFLDPEKTFMNWHKNHVSFKWLKGNRMETGAVAYTEQYAHGDLHKVRLHYTHVIPNRLIETKPLPKILRLFLPRFTLEFSPTEKGCLFKAVDIYWLPFAFLFKKMIEKQLAEVRQHKKEKGENLKRIIEERE